VRARARLRRPDRAAFTALALVAGLAALAPADARADIERFAVIVANNVGDRDEVELRFAEQDAAKMYDVLRQLGGFRPENMLLLAGESAGVVRQALISLNRRLRQETGTGRPATMLFVYYSGHADAATLHMAGSRLELRELEDLVAGSAAAFRVLVLDACRSGALTRVKGGAVEPPIRVSLRDHLAGEGTVFLTASSANEDAQESEEIRGSFFTHHLVSGLLGAADANSDGHVVLDEAYRYAYDHTLRASSRTLVGTQHPTFRYDLRGQGQIVLTRVLGQNRAIVAVPPGRSYILFRGGPDGPVVAEVGSYDAARRLSVKPGRYFLRARATRYLLEGTVDLASGAARTITDAELRRIDYARFVRKGVGDIRAVHGPIVGIVARASLFEAGPCLGPFAGYAIEMGGLTVVPRVSLCSGRLAAADADGREISSDIRLSREWDMPWLTVGLGLMPGLSLVSDSAAVDGEILGGYRTVAMLGTVAAATVELAGSSYAVLELGAHTYVQRKRTLVFDPSAGVRDPPRDVDDELDAAIVVRSGLGFGVRW
jgi:hypothetical protein